MDLAKQQDKLQKEAKELLEELKLIEELSKYGKVRVMGSVYLKLMTWRDIDIEVIGDFKEEDYWEIAKYLFHQPRLNDVSLADYGKDNNLGYYKAVYLNARVWTKDHKDRWKFDIWFLKPGQSKLDDLYKWVESKLNDENRLAILIIKNAVWNSPNYRKVYTSYDIYKAVLDEGVGDLEGFKDYLKKTGRELGI